MKATITPVEPVTQTVTITMTAVQASHLYRIAGNIGGGFGHCLTLTPIMDYKGGIRDTTISVLYEELSKLDIEL